VHASVLGDEQPITGRFPCVQGALQRLQAKNCDKIRRVAIQLPAGSPLRDVNLGGCVNLSKATISVDGLQSLNLQHCVALTELHIHCSHLRCVDANVSEVAHPGCMCVFQTRHITRSRLGAL
jgi:hypothetical protein